MAENRGFADDNVSCARPCWKRSSWRCATPGLEENTRAARRAKGPVRSITSTMHRRDLWRALQDSEVDKDNRC